MGNKILLIADGCVDEFVYGSVTRLCPDFPAQILDETHITQNGGMGVNVANNIISLGGEVDLIVNANWRQIRKIRLCHEDSGYIFVRWDKKEPIERVVGLDQVDFSQYSVCAISDYDKGFIFREDIAYVATKIETFLDTKKKVARDFEGVSYIKFNHSEYLQSKETLTPILESKIIETLGKRGCRFGSNIYPVEELEVRSTSGAGDSFYAALLVEYVKNRDIVSAIKFANKVASIVISKKGVATVSLDELR